MGAKIRKTTSHYFNKLKAFEIDAVISKWWRNESAVAKVSFLSALVIGFVSHLFVYTWRYYGRDDMGMITRGIGPFGTGRWFNGRITSTLAHSYVLPLVYGLLVAFFLAAAAFYVCKIFKIDKKVNAVLIGALLSTFPSIANTNLFLYETASYHFAVLLAVLAVFVTIRYKYGFVVGAALAVLTLATYQTKFNIVLALCLFYMICRLLEGARLKEMRPLLCKFALLVGLGGLIYAVSLPLSMNRYGSTYNAYRGFSPDSVQSRLLSVEGLGRALEKTYVDFYRGFFDNFYFVVDGLKYAYLAALCFALIFVVTIIVKKKIYKQAASLVLIVISFALIPLASNFSGFFDANSAYGIMIYPFVFSLVFIIVLSEQCKSVFPLLRSVFVICIFSIVCNYIVVNNIYYLRAHHSNQRAYSLTIRILDRIEPLLPLTTSNRVTVFGGLPNEYFLGGEGFGAAERIRDGAALQHSVNILNYNMGDSLIISIGLFGKNINTNHGVGLSMLNVGDKRDRIGEEVLNSNMPVWPAEGSVGIINDVIVVNFGLADVVFEEDESGQFFRARHWISEGHAKHDYEYTWQVYRNGEHIGEPVTNDSLLYLDVFRELADTPYTPHAEDSYQVSVTVRNADTDFEYPSATIEVPAGSYTAG